jgi:hypothetical protein
VGVAGNVEVVHVFDFFDVIVSQKFDFASALDSFSSALGRQRGGSSCRGRWRHWKGSLSGTPLML